MRPSATERHDIRDLRPAASTLVLLLREADWLDMLGAIGIARELAWGPNDLPAVLERIRLRRRVIPPRLTLPAAQVLALPRVAEMDRWSKSAKHPKVLQNCVAQIPQLDLTKETSDVATVVHYILN